MDELLGRYGTAYQTDIGTVQLGDFILAEGGGGEFIPYWVCDEAVRFPLEWRISTENEGRVFEVEVHDLPPGDGPILLEGPLDGCFESRIPGDIRGERQIVDFVPVDGVCPDRLINVVCVGTSCDTAVGPECAAE